MHEHHQRNADGLMEAQSINQSRRQTNSSQIIITATGRRIETDGERYINSNRERDRNIDKEGRQSHHTEDKEREIYWRHREKESMKEQIY